jgi:peroxiredoxin (alkyl hydroperoxide reductase subunit C)
MAYVDGGFKKISLSDYLGKYVVLFFYPLDFTFVCPTEICAFNDAAKHFRDTNCELVACSVDSHFSHMEYSKKPRSQGGLGEMQIPILADITKSISRDYGVLTPDGAISFRGTFIIDKNGVLRHSSVNDLPVGRNPDETLRLVKAF